MNPEQYEDWSEGYVFSCQQCRTTMKLKDIILCHFAAGFFCRSCSKPIQIVVYFHPVAEKKSNEYIENDGKDLREEWV